MVTFQVPGYTEKQESEPEPEPETSENEAPVFGDSMTEHSLRRAVKQYSEWCVANLEPLEDVDLENVTVEISNMKTEAGKAIWKKSKDRFITRYSHRAYSEWGWKKFKTTVRHELIHIWQYQQMGEGGHGADFKWKAEKLDCTVYCERFSTDYKYELYCTGCDDFVTGRHKRSKSVKNPSKYKSKCCGEPLRSQVA